MKIKSLLLSTVAAASLFAIGSTAANADTVTVKSGDTVAKIAAANNTTVSAIEKANNLSNVNLIYVGDQLEVNGTSTTSSTSTSNVSTTATTANNANTSATTQTTSQPSTASTTNTTNSASTTSATSGSDSSAKAWIAGKESGGSYSASNGNYYGKYQLSKSYLNGDYSAANQEKVANNYVSSRYGSWSAAKAHWLSNGWY